VEGNSRLRACSTASAHEWHSAQVLHGAVPAYPVSHGASSASIFRTAECWSVTSLTFTLALSRFSRLFSNGFVERKQTFHVRWVILR